MHKYLISLSLVTIFGLNISIFTGDNTVSQYSGNCFSRTFNCLFPCSFCNPDGTACCPFEAPVVWCHYTDAAGQEKPGACQTIFSAVPCAWPYDFVLASYIACSNRYNACVTNNPSENRGSLCVGQLCGRSCWENFCSKNAGNAFFHDFFTRRNNDVQMPGSNNQMK